MKIVMQLSRPQMGVYKDRPYLSILGRSDSGEWIKAMAWDSVAEALSAKIENLTQADEDLASRRAFIDCSGYTKSTDKVRRDGTPYVENKFIIKSFNFLSGPSLEAARTRLDCAITLAAATRAREAGDLEGAFRMLEGLAASIARIPAPSLRVEMPAAEMDPPAELNGGPEEAAAQRIREADAARGGPEAPVSAEPALEVTPEASVAAEVPGEAVEVEAAAEVASESEAVVEEASPIEASADATEDDEQTFGDAPEAAAEANEEPSEPEVAAAEEKPSAPAPQSRPGARPLPGRAAPPPPRRAPGMRPGM